MNEEPSGVVYTKKPWNIISAPHGAARKKKKKKKTFEASGLFPESDDGG